MGAKYVEKFGERDLPYLFKVLSVRTALSIQAHPNLELAKKLHEQFPDKYKDPNHKPEIAIALGDMIATYGFTSKEIILKNLADNPSLAEALGPKKGGEVDEEYLKTTVHKMFFELDTDASKEKRQAIINGMKASVESHQGDLSPHQKLCLRLHEQYGDADIGILFTQFLNIFYLTKGDSFICSPDEPHAYISGDLVESMANSDNVVRGGLTPKYKDTETLYNMLKYEFKNPTVSKGETKNGGVEYQTGFSEFLVH